MKLPTLSFCITCKDELENIRGTLRKNLDDNVLQQSLIEFVLIDFNSKDGLSEWIIDNFHEELETGYLKLFYVKELSVYNSSRVKNIAAKCSVNDIIVNLDSDSFTGNFEGAQIINAFYSNNNIIYHQYNGKPGDRSFGKISIHRHYFELFGGYDESLNLLAYQNTDFIRRLLKYGLRYENPYGVFFYDKLICIQNEKITSKEVYEKYSKEVYENFSKFHKSVLEGVLIANDGLFGITEDVCRYYKKQ